MIVGDHQPDADPDVVKGMQFRFRVSGRGVRLSNIGLPDGVDRMNSVLVNRGFRFSKRYKMFCARVDNGIYRYDSYVKIDQDQPALIEVTFVEPGGNPDSHEEHGEVGYNNGVWHAGC